MSNLKETTLFGIFRKRAIPEGAVPVNDFQLEKYLGRWYEIGRLDFFWEKKSLSNVFAEYSLNKKGTVNVKNTGYQEDKSRWSSFDGEARFRAEKNIAALEVSFFAGAWAGYNLIAVDPNYSYALVFGRSLDYLWLLSRTRTMPSEIKDQYLKIAKEIGYDIDKITWTDQSREIS